MKEHRYRQVLYRTIILDSAILGIIILRLLILVNDTPFGISTGQELSTDPPQYTSFARNRALFDNWEVYESRYRFFVNNFITIFSYPFFKLLGTGRAQSNLIALLHSLVLILACYGIWLKRGFGIALLGIIFLGFNYVFLNYGSLTFLEIASMALIGIGSYFVFRRGAGNLSLFASGATFASAAIYGKLLAAVFLPLVMILLLIEYTGMDTVYKKAAVKRIVSFITGYSFVIAIWLIFFYFPAKGDIVGYLAEISTGMYGFPKALTSVKMFLVQFLSYGFDFKLWFKQPILLIAGSFGSAALMGLVFSHKKQLWKKVDFVDLFHTLWFIALFLFLFPWNYRPLRYALILFPPLSYLSARWILALFRNDDIGGERKWPSYFFALIAGAYISTQLWLIPKFEVRSSETLNSSLAFALAGGVTTVGALFIVDRFELNHKNVFRKFGQAIAIVLVLMTIVTQIYYYYSNNLVGRKTIYNASRDVGLIIKPDAVIIGSYSSSLTQETRIKSLIKMFGVPKVEADLFERVPATHVAIEKGGGEGSNESRAFRDYPTIMTNAPLIATYYLRGYPVNIYLISNTSPNPSARAYEPSLYEQAAIYLTIGKIDSAAYLLDKFESMSPPSIAAISLQDKIALARKDSEKHIRLLEMLTSLDDGNFIYWWMLAESYLRIQPPRALAAFGALKRAIALKPDEKRLLSQLQQLEPYVSRNH